MNETDQRSRAVENDRLVYTIEGHSRHCIRSRLGAVVESHDVQGD